MAKKKFRRRGHLNEFDVMPMWITSAGFMRLSSLLLAVPVHSITVNYHASLLESSHDAWPQPLPRIERLVTLALANHTIPGSTAVMLSGCPEAPLPAHAVLGLGEGGGSEEWVRAAGVCSCGVSCLLSRPLLFEHGGLDSVSLMPPAFQPPEKGGILNTQADVPVPTPQRERAAATVLRAQRWLKVTTLTMSGGPDKIPLRNLLLLLALALFGLCIAAAFVSCCGRCLGFGPPPKRRPSVERYG